MMASVYLLTDGRVERYVSAPAVSVSSEAAVQHTVSIYLTRHQDANRIIVLHFATVDQPIDLGDMKEQEQP